MRLPPGIDQSTFSNALQEFAGAVGQEWVFSSEADVALYDDSYTPFVGEPERQYLASAAVAPTRVEEVQQIVRTANKYRIPLYPISTGRNLGYGGSAPTYSGSVVVDLKRMNRVVEVNDEEAYAVVEPGVSFFDLYRYFEDNNHQLMVSTPEPGWGSPIGNGLDHGMGGVAGDNFGMVQGMEVVLPNGEVLRTGMGAVPTSGLWQNYRGFGPYIDGLFSQANFGIVTKMGFWFVRKPEVQTSFVVTSFKSDDLYPMIDTIQRLRHDGFLYTAMAGSPIRSSNNNFDGALSRHDPEVKALLDRRDGGSPDAWNQLGRKRNVPVSMVSGGLRGPARIVNAAIEHARDMFSRIPGTSFSQGVAYKFPLKVDEIDQDQRSFLGIPNLWAFSRIAVQGTSRGHYYFSPIIRATAKDIFAANQVIREVLLDSGDTDLADRFGWGTGLSLPKAYMMLYEFLITDDVALNRRRRGIFEDLARACGARGWAEYRSAPAFQDAVMAQYSYNNNALRRFHETVKDALDPNGILAPGKSGIWPRHLRST
ncbi:MAG TPA: FAD-binding oxidoreductase [Steroidobacteraceae bacterium]|jgi:4-cresol dehydrogenase (hydroxylating)|nr:FAD-binding oxidoreductase [Steroidobacteraceae bacterium]